MFLRHLKFWMMGVHRLLEESGLIWTRLIKNPKTENRLVPPLTEITNRKHVILTFFRHLGQTW